MDQARRFSRRLLLAACILLITVGVPQRTKAAELSFNVSTTVQLPQDGYSVSSGSDTWIKYKAKSTGYITISVQSSPQTIQGSGAAGTANAASGEFQLYNAKKNTALSNVKYYLTSGANPADYSMSYGVKKGASYYIRMRASAAVSVSCNLTKVSESSGSKKTKAKSIKKGKTIRGIIPAGDKSADWYKIVIPKKQTLHIYYSGLTDNKLKLTFSGTYLKTAKKYVYCGVTSLQHTYSTERVQPGTYYVKVERGDSKSSGYYTLKWK